MKIPGMNLPPLAYISFLSFLVPASIALAEESIPVPALHLDAGDSESVVLGEGDRVVEWRDAAGSAARFVPSGEQPRFVSEYINGRPAIRFGDGAFLVGSGATAPIANGVPGMTVIAVVLNEEEGAQNIVRIGGGHAATALRFMLGRRTSDWRVVARRVDRGDLQNLAGGNIMPGEWSVITGTVDFENAQAALAIDGEEVAASDSFLDSGTATGSDSLMFRIGNDHQGQFWQGGIAEILVYDRALSTAERQTVEMYLNEKYGIGDLQEFEGEELGARDPFGVAPGDLPNEGVLFVNHETEGRSGHGGHAITEARNGDIIAFYSNVSGEAFGGHGTSGWSEYRISEDGGRTWSDPHILEYSMEVWQGDEYHSALVDEVMTAPNGNLVAIAGRYTDYRWGRTTPVYMLSDDHGRTWSEAREIDPEAGVREVAREHASLVHDETLFVLFNAGTRGEWPGPHSLYVSTDNGETFARRSTLPLDHRTWYGAMTLTPEGHLIAYSYLTSDEHHLHYTVSRDGGHTWSDVKTTYFAKRIRNPQVSDRLGGLYFLHGRSGQEGEDPRHLVLYTSENAIDWDEGIFLNRGSTRDLDSYSTNAIIGRFDSRTPERLLVSPVSPMISGGVE